MFQSNSADFIYKFNNNTTGLIIVSNLIIRIM